MKLKRSVVFSYMFGDLGSCLLSYMVAMYFQFYCTNMLQISLVTVGIIMFACRVWDAANDIIIGTLVDHTNTKIGKARPWIKWFAVPCVLSAIVMFTAPPSGLMITKIIWVTIGYFAFALFYTTVNLPYGSLMPLMTRDYANRASLSGIRMVGAMIGLLLVSAVTLPLVSVIGENIGTRAYGYSVVITIFGIGALISFYIVYFNCHELSETEKENSNKLKEKKDKISFKKSLNSLLKNKQWIIVFILTCLNYIRIPLTTSALTYYFLYYFKMDETGSALFSTASVLCGFILIPFVSTFVKKFDYKKTLIVAFILSSVFAIGGFLSGTNMKNSLVFYSLYTMFSMVPTVAVISMLADTIEYGAYKNSFRQDGLGFAANSFGSKAMPAIGSLIMTFIFAIAGLDTTQGIDGVQSSSAIFSLRFIEFLLPAIITGVQALIVCKYRLTFDIMQKINSENEKKRNNPDYIIQDLNLNT